MKVWLVPCEYIARRMYEQQAEWMADAFHRLGHTVEFIGDRSSRAINTGQFLDVYETNRYKSDQLATLIDFAERDVLQDGDLIFFMDLWFPGLEALAYIKALARRRFRIKGLLHAGCYDESDYITQNGCAPWGLDVERAWLKIADEVFVGSHYHANLIRRTHGEITRLTVVDWPVVGPDAFKVQPKENIVVFPHRLSADKQPEHFDIVRKMLDEQGHGVGMKVQWVRTGDLHLSKADYYGLLSRAKVVFSSARHENVGIAMLEGVAAGCWPVAPDRCAYREYLAEFDLYTSLREAADMICERLIDGLPPAPRYGPSCDHIALAACD